MYNYLKLTKYKKTIKNTMCYLHKKNGVKLKKIYKKTKYLHFIH